MVLLLGSTLVCAQLIDLDGSAFDPATKQLIPVFQQGFRGTVPCSDARVPKAQIWLVEIGSGGAAATPGMPKFATASDRNGRFFFLWAPKGRWKLVAQSSCGGEVRRASQTIRIDPQLAQLFEREITAEMGEMKISSRKIEHNYTW